MFWALWLPFASPKRGQKTGNIPSNLNLPGTGDVPRWELPTMHTPAPGTRWGLEEARKLTSLATFRSSYLWLPMCFLREPGWSVFRNHLDMKNLKEVSAPSICERLHPVFKSGCWAPKGGHCIMQMLVPAHNVFWRKSFTARTITVPELGFKISIAVLFGIIQRFNSEPRA